MPVAHRLFVIVALLSWACMPGLARAAAKPSIAISLASWSGDTLSVRGQLKNFFATTVDLRDGSGRLLGQAAVNNQSFEFVQAGIDRPELLCSIQAETPAASALATVKGRMKSCAKVPECKILKPSGSITAAVGEDIVFSAKASLKDKSAKPLRMEWDFAGGAMGEEVPNSTPTTYLRPTTAKTTVKFVRDNSRYRVRFTAWDKQLRYCEDFVDVVVGSPPEADPGFQADLTAVQALAQTSQQAAPAAAAAMAVQAGDWVVMPFQDWTMQTATDARTLPNLYIPLGPPANNINAVVYEKARQPKVVDNAGAELFYAAASNPADPVGTDSINSTSQNWPVGAPLKKAIVQKSDWFGTYARPNDQTSWLDPGYFSFSYTGFLDPLLPTVPDEGYHGSTINPDHGRYMPGIASPYRANDPQPFSRFDSTGNQFATSLLPVTDIDDAGRVNPTPLFRVEARRVGETAAAAVADLAISASRDLHCRECHTKGGLGANPEFPKYALDDKFIFQAAEGDTLFDLEYAAIRNTTVPHPKRETYTGRMHNADPAFPLDDGFLINSDGPLGCANGDGSCHTSAMQTLPFNQPIQPGHGGPLATDVHLRHGYLQYADSNKGDIARYDTAFVKGAAKLFEPSSAWSPKTGSLPNSLFPVKDANGNLLAMEENCLKCHGGLREQSYRDRMYSAGITCYQCHGDVLAVASAFRLSAPSPDGRDRRQPWIDEPDCGSCHMGNANRGKKGKDGYFGPGVMRLAFDESDPSATSRWPDYGNADETRFAVPLSSLKLGDPDPATGEPFETRTRLYRASRDNHGQVPCAACHGAAHAIWPVRDPNSNDNVTSRQLQGHSGPIAECGVCHTADSFAKSDDLDEGLKAADPKPGVLGGPHNMHPVNDPNWWKNAELDTTPNDGSGQIKGGWHNDYAKKEGRNGEDQCAACHGNDHKGTRLSKTPVDREFVDQNGNRLLVKAGTEIGCNLCHDIAKSCTASPAGFACGKPSERVASSQNRKPVITSASETPAIVGEDYRHRIEAMDPEGSAVTLELESSIQEYASFDISTHTVTIPAAKIMEWIMDHGSHYGGSYGYGADKMFAADYYVTARDTLGAETRQLIRINATCPGKLVLDAVTRDCVALTITSSSAIPGLNSGELYRYRVTAAQRGRTPISFHLEAAPNGMSINAKTGEISWTPNASQAGVAQFAVLAKNRKGASARQELQVKVCAPPTLWDLLKEDCIGPVAVTSTPAIRAVAVGDSYQYQVVTTHRDNLPLTYSLTTAPPGMTIGAGSGLIEWMAQASASGPVSFTVRADDGQGGAAEQTSTVAVCVAPDVPGTKKCVNPITFTAYPEISGLAAGETFSFQTAVTHAKGLPVSFSLTDAPNGMTIDPATGQIDWVAVAPPDGLVSFLVNATDNGTPQATNSVNYQLTVCEAGMRWDANFAICQGPVIIDPIPPLGVDVDATLTYQVTATVPGNGSIGYSLIDQPSGMTIDGNGLITWPNAVIDPNVGPNFSFTVVAEDSQHRLTSQIIGASICEAPSHWSSDALSCL